MDVLSGTILSKLVDKNKILFQQLLPELIKKLILCNLENVEYIRIPGKDDVWAPGFDGVVETSERTMYVCEGKSVWEFGTNEDILRKINADYKKRTEDALGINKNITEFYLVVPYIWAQKCSIQEWEKEHKNGWKDVHVYDAVMLAEWVNSEPAVFAWLIEKIGSEINISFSSVSVAWNRFSSKTFPRFAESLFTGGRDKKVEEFLTILGKQKIIKVRADTSIDSFGFCLTSIMRAPERLNSVVVIDNQQSYIELSRFIINKIFLLNFKLTIDVINGNTAILCYNKEDRTISPDIELSPLTKTLFDKSMMDMGLDEISIYGIYEKTHGNLLSLIRKIPGQTIYSNPKWANQEQIDLLTPMVLLRSFNTKSECDKKLVSFLAGKDYDTIFEKYNAWLRLEDSPIKIINDYIVLVNFEETWQVLCLTSASPLYDRFIQVIEAILLCSVRESKSNLDFVDSRLSNHLFNLFRALVYYSYTDNDSEKIEKSVDLLLQKCASATDLLEYLSIVAEAVPSIVINFLQIDFRKENGIISKAFTEKLLGRDYCKILFTLDELVLHEETRVDACNLLFKLCLKTQNLNFKTSNSPKDCLLNALCLWNSHTLFTVSDKRRILEKYMAENAEYATKFAADLILKDNIHFSVRESPRKSPKTIAYEGELVELVNKIGEKLFAYFIDHHMIEDIKKLLSKYKCFYESTLINASSQFLADDYDLEQITSLNICLRRQAYYYIEDSKNSKGPQVWISALNAWIEATTPSDVIGRVGWLFYDYCSYYSSTLFGEPIDDSNVDNKIATHLLVEKKRVQVLYELTQKCSRKDMIRLVQCSKDSVQMGAFYAQHLRADLLLDFINEARRLNKMSILQGMIDGVEKDVCISVLNTLTPSEQQAVLVGLNRRDIVEWVDTLERKRSYWSRKTMQEYDEDTYVNLLEFNPGGLLSYYHYINGGSLKQNIKEIIKIIKAMLLSGSFQIDDFISCQLYDIVGKSEKEEIYSEDWAELCEQLYVKGWIQQYPEVLKRYYFINPYRICERIESDYSKLCFDYELPKEAFTDKEQFDYFIQVLMEIPQKKESLLYVLGGILAKVPVGSDGIFPHEYVREVLERNKEYGLSNEILRGMINSQGFRMVEDGTFEFEKAEKYIRDANRIEIDFPETANLLRLFSKECIAQGNRDRLISEIGIISFALH